MLSVRPQAGGGTRYELLETLRDYGRTRLDDEHAVELFTGHAAHFAAEAAAFAAELQGPDEPRSMARAESSFADLRAAQRFALEIGALDQAFGLIASIREFAMRAMRYEVFAWADAACRAPGALDHPLAPLLTGMRAYGAWVRGEFDLAVSLAEETRRLEEALDGDPERPGRAGPRQRAVHRRPQRPRQRRGGPSARAGGGVRQRLAGRARVLHGRGGAELRGPVRRGASARRAGSRARARGPAARPIWRRPRSPKASPVRTEDAALDAFVTADRIARTAGNRWMSAFAHTEASGLLVARGDVDEGCAGLAEMLVALVPRRRLVAAVAHALPMRDRAAPHRQRRAGHGAGRNDRDLRRARRRADVLDPARRRVRHAGRVDRRAGRGSSHRAPVGRRHLSRSTTSCSARAAPCSRATDAAVAHGVDSATSIAGQPIEVGAQVIEQIRRVRSRDRR